MASHNSDASWISVELIDLWSKKIYRRKMIVWSGATFILRWPCLLLDTDKDILDDLVILILQAENQAIINDYHFSSNFACLIYIQMFCFCFIQPQHRDSETTKVCIKSTSWIIWLVTRVKNTHSHTKKEKFFDNKYYSILNIRQK